MADDDIYPSSCESYYAEYMEGINNSKGFYVTPAGSPKHVSQDNSSDYRYRRAGVTMDHSEDDDLIIIGRNSFTFVEFKQNSKMADEYKLHSLFAEYLKEINNSEGFYVTPISFPGLISQGDIICPLVMGNSNEYPYCNAGTSRVHSEDGSYFNAWDAAQFALDEHNTKMGTHVVLIDVTRVNLLRSDAKPIYYITMTASEKKREITFSDCSPYIPRTCYEAKVLKNKFSFICLSFRRAPYYEKDFEFCDIYSNVVWVHKLLPWMDESYLYYKCFYSSHKDILGIRIHFGGNSTPDRAVVRLRSSEAIVKFLDKYSQKPMPSTKDVLFELEGGDWDVDLAKQLLVSSSLDPSLREYLKETLDSEGIYVTPVEFPEHISRKNIIFPLVWGNSNNGLYSGAGVTRDYSEDDDFLNAKEAARFALRDHNTKMSDWLGFTGIERLNVQHTDAGTMYYITMTVCAFSFWTHYQAKVLKHNAGFEVKLFRLAPYYEDELDLCEAYYSDFVHVNNLLPWMDEAYLYYKCFYSSREDILGIRVRGDGMKPPDEAVVHLRSPEAVEEFLEKYHHKPMPLTRDNVFELERGSLQRFSHHYEGLLRAC